MSSEYPDDLRYTKEHEWARIEGTKAIIGITKFAVEQLGDITQVELPKEGEKVKVGEPFGTVESVKAVSDLFAPLSGNVVKVNDPLSDSPEYINDDCYDEGWMIQIELSNPDEVQKLLTREQYSQFVQEADWNG